MAKQTQLGETTASAHIKNIGGIDECEVKFTPGVTILTGQNATNRTSFLQSLNAALGGTQATRNRKSDEDGEVELTIDGETYTRTLPETGTTGGNPYTEDSELVDIFATLLESNPIRRAVRDGDGDELYRCLMTPVNEDEIQKELERVSERKNEIVQKIRNIENERKEFEELERQKVSLEEEIEEKEKEYEEKKAELDELDEPEDNDEIEDLQRTIDAKKSKLDSKKRDINTIEETIEAEEEKLQELKSELEELEEKTGDKSVKELENEIDTLRDKARAVERKVNYLDDILELNQSLLGDSEKLPQELRVESDSPTDTLVDDAEMKCWTCGSEVSENTIKGAMETYREARKKYHSKETELQSEIDDLKSKKRSIENEKDRIATLKRNISSKENSIDQNESNLEETKKTVSELEEEVEELEEEYEAKKEEYQEQQKEADSQYLDISDEVSKLDREIGQKQNELERVEEKIEQIEAEEEKLPELEEQKEELTAEKNSLRSRVDDIVESVADEFNTRMETVIDLLEYKNIARVWVEKEFNDNARRASDKYSFTLHIVRTGEKGDYEDSVETLSESEREVIGFVAALAGYLTHDISSKVPMILLDSLESIDAERIGDLIGYFQDESPFIVASLLPEDSESLSDDYQRITPEMLQPASA